MLKRFHQSSHLSLHPVGQTFEPQWSTETKPILHNKFLQRHRLPPSVPPNIFCKPPTFPNLFQSFPIFSNFFQPRFKPRLTFYKLALTLSPYLQTLGFILISRVGTPFSVNALIKHCMQVVFPAPVGPMVINPCLTNEVSYSCTILRFQLGKFTNPISRDWLAIARCKSFQAWLWSLIPGNMSSMRERKRGSSSSTNLLRFISL